MEIEALIGAFVESLITFVAEALLIGVFAVEAGVDDLVRTLVVTGFEDLAVAEGLGDLVIWTLVETGVEDLGFGFGALLIIMEVFGF